MDSLGLPEMEPSGVGHELSLDVRPPACRTGRRSRRIDQTGCDRQRFTLTLAAEGEMRLKTAGQDAAVGPRALAGASVRKREDGGVPVRLPKSLRPSYPVRGERPLLRPLTSRDTEALLAYLGREDVCRYVPFEPMTRDGITECLAGQWARTELTGEGQSLTLGAEVRQAGELAGDVILFWDSREHAGGKSAMYSIQAWVGAATPPRR